MKLSISLVLFWACSNEFCKLAFYFAFLLGAMHEKLLIAFTGVDSKKFFF